MSTPFLSLTSHTTADKTQASLTIAQDTTDLYWLHCNNGQLPFPATPAYVQHAVEPSVPIIFGLQLIMVPHPRFLLGVTRLYNSMPQHSTNINKTDPTMQAIRQVLQHTTIVSPTTPPNTKQSNYLSTYFGYNKTDIHEAAITIQLAQNYMWNRTLPNFVLEQEHYKSQRPIVAVKATTINFLTALCYYFANHCQTMTPQRNNTSIATTKDTLKQNKMVQMTTFFVDHYGYMDLGTQWHLTISKHDLVNRNYNSVVDYFIRKSKHGMYSFRYLGMLHLHNIKTKGHIIRGPPYQQWELITTIYKNITFSNKHVYLLQDEYNILQACEVQGSDIHHLSQQYEKYYSVVNQNTAIYMNTNLHQHNITNQTAV
jgi:hypothetical protein